MIRRAIVHRKNRRNLGKDQQPAIPNITAANSIVANKWRMTFSRPVLLLSLPTDFTVNGAAPTAVTQVAANVYDLTYTVNVAAGQVYVIPSNSPNIRSAQGGYVAAATGTF